jgi:hypothetical protein
MKEKKPRRKSFKKEPFVDTAAVGGEEGEMKKKRKKFQPDFNADTKQILKDATAKPLGRDVKKGGPKKATFQEDDDEPVLVPPPIDSKTLEKYSRGEGVQVHDIAHPIYRKKIKSKEKKIEFSTQEAARNEILLTEEPGFV